MGFWMRLTRSFSLSRCEAATGRPAFL